MGVSLLMMYFSVQEQTSEMGVNDGEQPGTSGEPPSISGHHQKSNKLAKMCVASVHANNYIAY